MDGPRVPELTGARLLNQPKAIRRHFTDIFERDRHPQSLYQLLLGLRATVSTAANSALFQLT